MVWMWGWEEEQRQGWFWWFWLEHLHGWSCHLLSGRRHKSSGLAKGVGCRGVETTSLIMTSLLAPEGMWSLRSLPRTKLKVLTPLNGGHPSLTPPQISLAFSLTHTHMCTHTHTCVYINAHTRMYACTHVHTHTHTNAHVNEHTCTRTHAHKHTHTYVPLHTSYLHPHIIPWVTQKPAHSVPSGNICIQ